jgi:hypothetical protein
MSSNKPVPGGGGGAGIFPSKSPGVAAGANGEVGVAAGANGKPGVADGEAGAMSERPQSG